MSLFDISSFIVCICIGIAATNVEEKRLFPVDPCVCIVISLWVDTGNHIIACYIR